MSDKERVRWVVVDEDEQIVDVCASFAEALRSAQTTASSGYRPQDVIVYKSVCTVKPRMPAVHPTETFTHHE